MAGPGVVTGERVGPFPGRLGADLVRAYAAATGDPSPRARAGEAIPPVAIVTQIWGAQTAGRAVAVPAAIQQAATGGVHGEHDVVLHRAIVPGEPLRTWVEGHGSRPVGRNSLVTLRYVTRDAGDAVVAEQWWSTVYLGTTCDRVGEPAPGHAFPDGARQRPVGEYAVEVDEDMARRYAEVSGDWSPHHFEVEAARRSGFDRPFLHGLCTMALCAQGVVELVARGDPDRVRRLAVRFARPTFLGERLVLRVYGAGPRGYAFEAESNGAAVVTHGRAELR
jgi:acyl dehydratase